MQTNQQKADAVMTEAQHIRNAVAVSDRVDVHQIEEDNNGAPADTTDYQGRALAFIYYANGREYRVLIEDITLDS